jgi:hypothetical protein
MLMGDCFAHAHLHSPAPNRRDGVRHTCPGVRCQGVQVSTAFLATARREGARNDGIKKSVETMISTLFHVEKGNLQIAQDNNITGGLQAAAIGFNGDTQRIERANL